MSAIPLLSVNLAVVVLESLLYGVYALLSLFTVYLMMTRRRENLKQFLPAPHSTFYSPVALGTLTLFMVITSHWVINVVRLYLAFQGWEDGPGPQLFYADLSHTTEVLKYGFLVASWLTGDGFLIHRLWAIWEFRTRIIIFPTITLLGLVGFGAGLTYQLSTYSSNDNIFESAFRRWSTGLCFFSMLTGTYTMGFVHYKLWYMHRVLKSFGMTTSNTILRIMIDGAVLLIIPGLVHLVSYQCGSNLQVIAIDCTPVTIGISNLLIQIRLHWNLTEQRAASAGLESTHDLRFSSMPGKSEDDFDLEQRIGSRNVPQEPI
ncbi:hypothetical protein FB451DRAFT_1266698 [Mycena latifolia]|nr:hypothetical protein FB451DRAFT_1266698 [Mycena latifolia]